MGLSDVRIRRQGSVQFRLCSFKRYMRYMMPHINNNILIYNRKLRHVRGGQDSGLFFDSDDEGEGLLRTYNFKRFKPSFFTSAHITKILATPESCAYLKVNNFMTLFVFFCLLIL